MLAAHSNTTLIGRLRVKTGAGHQQRLRHVLSNASLSPAGLPSSAILVVRKLADPLPSRLRVNQFDLEPDPAWQKAMVSELEHLLARTIRPAFQAVPAAAASVLFWDRAELLACMGLDWLSGTLGTNWWWREFFRNADPINSLLKQWTSSPEFVPAALLLLGKRASAVAFVRSLPEYVCLDLLQSLKLTHGLPPPDVAHAQAEDGENLREQKLEGESFSNQRVSATSPEPPWLPWIPEASASGLSPTQRVLLAQALMLARVPSQARGQAFQARLLRWQTTARKEESAAPTVSPSLFDLTPADGSGPETGGFSRQKHNLPPQKIPSASVHRDGNHEMASIKDAACEKSEIELREVSAEAPVPGVAAFEQAQTPPAASAGVDQSQRRQESCDFPEPDPLAAASPRDEHQTGVAVETRFGGCFFLLNVFLHLNLYGDFTSPRAKNLELNIWDLLALVAAEFTEGEAETDTIGIILAALAGRSEGELPGASFIPPHEWRLPPEWLDAFPEPYEAEPAERGGRLVSTHPAGFPIRDVAADGDSEPPGDPMHRWVDWLTTYLRARLVRATGRMDAVDLLARLPGRIASTHAHVDVTFPLNHHPVELRFAGLDRDPGWIPAAGRHVAFHFD